mmetsp:Transcript_28444/g.91570  ORF Transcript_28444/g.91570 Transcript_28444/m.91570 type:complete len:125 (-) Transcript_28444:4337-4711(-)
MCVHMLNDELSTPNDGVRASARHVCVATLAGMSLRSARSLRCNRGRTQSSRVGRCRVHAAESTTPPGAAAAAAEASWDFLLLLLLLLLRVCCRAAQHRSQKGWWPAASLAKRTGRSACRRRREG